MFVLLVLVLAQMAVMVKKRICCTWKFQLALFLLSQLVLLFLRQICLGAYLWTYVIAILRLLSFICVLYFFAQYFYRVVGHSDRLNPFVHQPHSRASAHKSKHVWKHAKQVDVAVFRGASHLHRRCPHIGDPTLARRCPRHRSLSR